MNPDAIYVRGICLYYQDSVDKAFQHFQQVLKLVPDHHKAKDVYKVLKKSFTISRVVNMLNLGIGMGPISMFKTIIFFKYFGEFEKIKYTILTFTFYYVFSCLDLNP